MAGDSVADGRCSVGHGSIDVRHRGLYGQRADGAGVPQMGAGMESVLAHTGDRYGNGHVDLVTTTREGYLMAWGANAPASANDQWPRWHHDLYNSSNYDAEATPPGAPRDPSWRPGLRVLIFVVSGAAQYAGTGSGLPGPDRRPQRCGDQPHGVGLPPAPAKRSAIAT